MAGVEKTEASAKIPFTTKRDSFLSKHRKNTVKNNNKSMLLRQK
jgi:hypothetical protein